MAILVLVCIAVLVVGIAALVTIPVKHVEGVLVDLYWRLSMQVGPSHWERRTSRRKPHGDVRNARNVNAGDPEKKPAWEYELQVWERLRLIHAEGHDQWHPHWPSDKMRPGEDVKTRSELYRATFQVNIAERYPTKLSERRWRKLRKDANYRLGLNVFGRVRTIRSPRQVTPKPAPARAQSPAPNQPSTGGND